jgi:hypothetical protein
MFRLRPFIAEPLYDAVTDAGGGSVATELVYTPDAGDEGSLSDHEAAFSPGVAHPAAEPEPEPDAYGVARDEQGKFTKPRHRAKSQQATPEDVPRIQELTRKHREAEERATAAERRADEAERRAAERRESREEPPAPKPVAAKATFPTFEDYVAMPGHETHDWYTYQDARTDWHYEQRRAAERAEEARTGAEKTYRETVSAYQAQLPAVRAELPDFDTVIASIGPRDVSLVVQHATFQVGPRAAYYLAQHLEELRELTADTLMTADTPGFAAAVAATKRLLARLVAPEQRSSPSTRTAAGSTGAARATTPPIAPKPPTLVRTGAVRDADEPPDDESMSLADHEKAYGSRRRR